jgi:hypothetical protein
MQKLLAAVAAAAITSGCGYISGPLAPLANVPGPIVDVAALQRGGVIYVHFTAPARTTENVLIGEPLTLDLRIGLRPPAYSRDQWAAAATRLPERESKPGILASYEIPAAAWVGKDAVIAARAIGANGKETDWSNFVTLPVVTPPAQPAEVKAEPAPGGVRLTWRAPGAHFRVLRKAGDEPYAVAAPDLAQTEWLDAHVVVGTPYTYLVQTIQPLPGHKEAESDLSEPAAFTPQPPPAPITGLRAVPAPNSVELSWDTAGPDVTGYRIYRAEGGGAFEKVGETGAVPTYSDRAVEHGKTYRYSIAALDASGREGPRAAPVEVSLP